MNLGRDLTERRSILSMLELLLIDPLKTDQDEKFISIDNQSVRIRGEIARFLHGLRRI